MSRRASAAAFSVPPHPTIARFRPTRYRGRPMPGGSPHSDRPLFPAPLPQFVDDLHVFFSDFVARGSSQARRKTSGQRSAAVSKRRPLIATAAFAAGAGAAMNCCSTRRPPPPRRIAPMSKQVAMLVDGAALGRHVAPERGQRLLQPGPPIDNQNGRTRARRLV
jgi:hypothetical protein